MNRDELQLFPNEYKTACDTYSCYEPAKYFVGRPDAPLNTAMNICQTCTDNLVASVVELFGLHPKSSHANKETVSAEPIVINFDEFIEDQKLEVEKEPTLEEVVESLRTHAEVDELVAELGVKGLPGKAQASLANRKQYIIDNLPEGD